MSSALTDRMTAIGAPLGLRFNGETITREITGDTGSTESQTALVDFTGAERLRERGDEQKFDVEISVATSATVALGDTYLINSERFKVSTIHKPQNGLRKVELKRSEATEFRGGARS